MLKYRTGSKEKTAYWISRLAGRLRKRRLKKAVISAVTAACILAGSGAFTGFNTGALAEGVNKVDMRDMADTGDLSGKTVIIHSNDVHGAIDGYARMAALRKSMEDKGAEVIEADAGDYSSEIPGEDAFGALEGFMMMRLAGYDVATFGDAEFTQGYDKLRHDVGGSKIRLICANAFKDNKTILSPSYVYQTAGGQKIGFVGVTGAFGGKSEDGIDILSGDEMYECVKAEADSLKKSGADTIIALAHLGADGGEDGSSLELSSKVDSIDFVIDGHSHNTMTEGPGGEPVQSAGEGFAYIGVVVLDINGRVEDNYIMSTKNIEPDANVQKEADKFKTHLTVAEISDGENIEAASSVNDDPGKEREGEVPEGKKSGKANAAAGDTGDAENNETGSDGAGDKAIVKDNVDNKTADSSDTVTAKSKKNAAPAGSSDTKDPAGETDNTEKKASPEADTEVDKEVSSENSADNGAEVKKSALADTTAAETTNADAEAAETTNADTASEKSIAGASEDNKTDEDRITLKDGKYEVVKGDCLWKIAERHLGDGARWNEIYELNKGVISNPSLIYVGQQLVLPPG